jgi:hypothetical protein
MGRIVPPFRELYQETVSDLTTELKGALVDVGHKSAFDLLLKDAWNPEVAAMGNSTLLTVLDKLNIMSTIHLRKLIATLVRENGQRDGVIGKLEERIGVLESRLNEIKKPNTDVSM